MISSKASTNTMAMTLNPTIMRKRRRKMKSRGKVKRKGRRKVRWKAREKNLSTMKMKTRRESFSDFIALVVFS